jgi:hypothetical protein
MGWLPCPQAQAERALCPRRLQHVRNQRHQRHRLLQRQTSTGYERGIQRKFGLFNLASYGDTSFWGFAQGSNGGNADTPCVPDGSSPCSTGGGALGGVRANGILAPNTFANIPIATQITSSEVNRWFLALDQSFEAAAFHLYAAYQHFDANIDLITGDVTCPASSARAANCRSAGNLSKVTESLDSFDVFYTGGRLYF